MALLKACASLLLVFAVSALLVSCEEAATGGPEQPPLVSDGPDEVLLLEESEEPPLLLDESEEPLLLLDDIGESDLEAPPQGPLADNSRCHVCHLNYEDEELAVTHARANVGCEKCHGSSDAHCSDEDNITAPSVLFPAEKIGPFCTECHTSLSEEHEPILVGTATEKKLCTDCHGEHRLAYRTREWDKVTGKLVKDDSVRMIGGE